MSSNLELKKIGQRIQDVRIKKGLSQVDFARKVNVSQKTLSNYERGASSPDSMFLLSLRAEFDVHSDWLLTGDAELARTKAIVSDNNYTLLPRYDVTASAGSGSFIDAENIKDKLSFSTKWLEHIGLNVKNAALLNANGDSMEPTIKDGSVLLLKLDEDEIKDGSIYVIQISGQTFVKRLKRDLKGVQILSDNPVYEPQHLTYAELEDSPMTIAGRVVWFGSYA